MSNLTDGLEAARRYEERFLFHGTSEPFKTKLGVGGDGILWTADTSAVAQSYIPEAGHTVLWHSPKYKLDDPPWPPDEGDTFQAALFELAGVRFDRVTYSATGRPSGWRELTPGATNRTVLAAVQALGYRPKRGGDVDGGFYEIKMFGDAIMPADWKLVGRLFILRPKVQLKLADITTGDPADLLDPEYLHYGRFKAFEKAGYDGVKVPDLLQSEHWGNFGHDSIALFKRALKKLDVRSIPATNYDPTDMAGWRRPTPEFVDFFLEQLRS